MTDSEQVLLELRQSSRLAGIGCLENWVQGLYFGMEILRGTILHTPKNPFEGGHLEALEDGGLVIENGKIVDLGPYSEISREYLGETRDLRGGLILPGFVDLHVHYPQVRLFGGLGLKLLDWLQYNTLPHEARFSDRGFARGQAKEFLRGMVKNGTTTAVVFGAHFAGAMDVFFEEAEALSFRAIGGMVISDRNLRPELHTSKEQALEDSLWLARKWHKRGKLKYALEPRFAISCSEVMMEACQEALQEIPDLYLHTHLNEIMDEPEIIRELYPWCGDRVHTYEHFGLLGERSVFAHNICPTDSELARMANAGASVAHCPCSHAYTGAGFFPMRRHLQHGVKFGLGSDIAGGTGFGLLKEGLEAYKMQNLMENGVKLDPTKLLYLATLAGARAVELEGEIGDFSAGKAADAVYVRPAEQSSFQVAFKHAKEQSPERMLAVAFTMATEADIAEVFIDGRPTFERLRAL